MKKFNIEMGVGLFMVIGILCLAYISIRMGKLEIMGGNTYDIKAVFSNSGGIKTGSSVVIAGVDVGRVKEISLSEYQANIVLTIPVEIKIQEDAIASVKTKGLIGEKYIDITPGGSEEILKPGDRLRETQPAIDMEQLISNFVFGKI
ncbi:MAG: outer membrane lipid asymmetry maintenance protein MlaD [Deltaproteobacteria bacterium CG_4_8_14_3_um_filter_51_11]|nr:outer membrane lipid asymmetry maintenance protein MlaD [bacterium]OIP42152.1 MAG: outer membrane lipid asymmetry maintenance protein MlaD [Desulfobacteraceae bacterium CG2_30_51_40]PIP45693.1 MAG: outer membrane lipid asymmetry maintenance protein MlaD [Deltaproteobacteria bacterium CG23_combo_of_CG06-09_8_20_14_all_51_20]PIX20105.1 MAG: outer membrane lipid asymmetry maintenance protein MlaD [Deltaproteobacteria bacterium CG_4_8_14_3_um_filter_51_11]PIY26854.1 MAG: outer membrane lipid asy